MGAPHSLMPPARRIPCHAGWLRQREHLLRTRLVKRLPLHNRLRQPLYLSCPFLHLGVRLSFFVVCLGATFGSSGISLFAHRLERLARHH